MPRTIAVSLAPAFVVAAAWTRLEQPLDRPFRVIGVAVLALLPALVRPLAARAAALVAAAAFGAWIAFGVSPFHPRHAPGTLWSRFSGGFLDFYDVKTPFDPRVHAEMRGVVLTAVFAFVAALAIAVAARRPLGAALVLLVGAGWPATLRGDAGALVVGGLILLGALVLLAGLTTRHVPRNVVPAAVAVALLAVVVSTSSAVAKSQLVSWQGWDPYTAPQPPVSVAFVWDAQYNGIRFPRKRTTVLEVSAPARSLYWRAAVLDAFETDRWMETLPLRADALEPKGVKLIRQDVRVLALSDTHLVGASVPLRYDAGDAPLVTHVPGIATLPSGLTRGFRYTAYSYAPTPTPAQLERSKPVYPVELVERGTFLDVAPRVNVPPFGAPGRDAVVAGVLDATPTLARYAPLQRAAAAVAGRARTPYEAAAALTQWFRSTGGFRYTNHPSQTTGPALVDFVTRTRAGYCQHFAGAMALMLRYLGVPARVAVGFSSGTYDRKHSLWKVTDHDAHAWVEAWFRGYGWLPFDPTPTARPGRGQLSAPYAAAVGRLGRGEAGRLIRGLPLGDPRQAAHRHGETEGTGVHTFTPQPSSGTHARGGSLLLLLLMVVGGLVVAVAGAKVALRRVRYLTRDPRRVAAACRRELADYLLDQRIDAARSATLHELGAIVRYELTVDPDAFVGAATAARFGPPAGARAAARQARRELRALNRSMRRRLRPSDRVRGLLSLRSFGFAS